MTTLEEQRRTRGRAIVGALPVALAAIVIGYAITAAAGTQPVTTAVTVPQEAEGFQWFWTLKGPLTTDAGNDMVVDEQGNVFIAGYHGGLDLDGDGTIDLPAKEEDPLFIKLSQRAEDQGVTTQWMRSPSSPGFHKSSAIAADGRGGAFVLGRFRETLSFESGLTLPGGGQNDAFLARYGAEGNLLWARAFGGPGQDVLFDVASDPAGNAYVVGSGSGSFPLDDRGTLFRAPRESAPLIASYDLDGRVRWLRVLDAPAPAGVVEVAPDGEVVISGEFEGAVDFDGDGSMDLPAPSNRDGFVARFNADGDFLGAWSVGAGPGKIVFARDGDLFLLGVLGGRVQERYGVSDFDGDGVADAAMKGEGPMSAWVARYARDGRLRWVRSYDLERPAGLATDGERIIITGSYHGVRDLDEDGVAERVDRTVDPSEESELAILILSGQDGRPERAWTAPGPGRDHAAAAVFLPGRPIVYVTGYIQLTADFTGDGEYGEGWAKCEELGDLFFASYRLAAKADPECEIVLDGTARRVEGQRAAALTWSGASSKHVDLYRNGERIATIANTGAYTDVIANGVPGPFTYRLIPEGARECASNTVRVDF